MATFVKKRVEFFGFLLSSWVIGGVVISAAALFFTLPVFFMSEWRQLKAAPAPKSVDREREPAGELHTILDSCGPLAFYPDPKKLILASSYEVRDLRENKILYRVPYAGKGGGVRYVFSPNGKLVAAAASLVRKETNESFIELRLRNALSGNSLLLLDTISKRTGEFAFSPDSKYIAGACGEDILICDVTTGKEVDRLHDDTWHVGNLVYHPEGKFLVFDGFSALHVWDVEKKRELKKFAIDKHSFHAPAISRNGNRLAAIDSWAEDVRAYHVKSRIHLWELPSCKEIVILPEQTGPLSQIAFHPNNRWLAVIGREKSVKIWDVLNRKLLRTLPLEEEPCYVAFSPDGRWLASAESRHVKVWDLAPQRR